MFYALAVPIINCSNSYCRKLYDATISHEILYPMVWQPFPLLITRVNVVLWIHVIIPQKPLACAIGNNPPGDVVRTIICWWSYIYRLGIPNNTRHCVGTLRYPCETSNLSKNDNFSRYLIKSYALSNNRCFE